VNDLILLRSLYGQFLNLLNGHVFTGGVALMLSLDLTLTLWALAPFPFLFLVVSLLSRRVFAQSVAVQEQLGALSTRAQENLSGIQQVKAYVQEEREAAAFRELGAEFRRRSLAMATLRGLMLALIAGFRPGTLVVLFVGGRRAGGAGSFRRPSPSTTLGLLAWPTVALGWIVNVFQRGVGAMQRIQEVLAAEPDISPAGEGAADGPPLDGAIEIRGLTFRFGGPEGSARGAAALLDVNLSIERGSRVAIVEWFRKRLVTFWRGSTRARRDDLHAGEDLAGIRRAGPALISMPQEAFLFTIAARRHRARPARGLRRGGAVALAGLERPRRLRGTRDHRRRARLPLGGQRRWRWRALLTDPRRAARRCAVGIDADTGVASSGRSGAICAAAPAS
jgi:hypothetical protein